jgi:plastocyanin
VKRLSHVRAVNTNHRARSASIVAAIALVLAAAPVSAATYTVRMPGYDFSPATRTIARGDSVKWKNNGFDDHDVYALQPAAYFSSGAMGGMDPGDTYTKAFRSAGTYPYTCRVHTSDGMRGKVRVPMRAVRSGGDFHLTLASATAESGYRHDVWVDRPGTSGWQHWTYTSSATATYHPTAGGTYKFKSRLQRISNGQTSRFSPVVSVTN